MGKLDTAVHHSHYDRRVSEHSVSIPGFLKPNVDTCGESVLTGIVVMPLIAFDIVRVVHLHRHRLHFHHRLCEFYPRDRCCITGCLGHRDIAVVADLEPPVQSGCALTFLEPAPDQKG